MRIAFFALALAGCGASPAVQMPASQPSAAKADTGIAVAPPLVAVGEHMTYKLELQGVELASFEIAVGADENHELPGSVIVQSHAKAVGLVQMVANIDDTFTSWIDVKTGRPLRWLTDEYATKSSDKERTVVDFAKRSGTTVPVAFHVNDQPPKDEPQTVSLPDVWDLDSFMVALRTWSPAPGSTIAVEAFRSRYMWHIDMTVHGKDHLETALGELPAIRLDGHTYKLDRNGQKTGDDARDFSVWISDDDSHVPLQTVAKTDYGDVKMTITDYQPGSGKPLRP